MTIQQSKRIGGRQLIKAAAVLFAIFEFILLYKHTKGDFANGILFFINEQANIFFTGFILLYFLTMYLAGRVAGYDVLIKKRAGIQAVLLYSFITALLIAFFFVLTVTLIFNFETQTQKSNETVQLIFISFTALFVAMVFIWFWAINKINRSNT